MLASSVALLALVPLAHAESGDPQRGRAKAAACTVCHGRDGISSRPDAPSLAGQIAPYVQQQLIDYRSGRRPHPVMNVVAASLSDQDIDDLAAWYAAIEVSTKLPP